MYPTRREMTFLPEEDPIYAMQGFTAMRLTPLPHRRSGPSSGRWPPENRDLRVRGAAHRIVLPRSAGWLGIRLGSTPRRRWRDQPPLGGDLERVADRRCRTAEVCGEPGHRPTLPAQSGHLRRMFGRPARRPTDLELVFPEPLRVQVGKSSRNRGRIRLRQQARPGGEWLVQRVRGRDAAAGSASPRPRRPLNGVDAAGRASTVAAPSKIPSLLVRITTRPSA